MNSFQAQNKRTFLLRKSMGLPQLHCETSRNESQSKANDGISLVRSGIDSAFVSVFVFGFKKSVCMDFSLSRMYRSFIIIPSLTSPVTLTSSKWIFTLTSSVTIFTSLASFEESIESNDAFCKASFASLSRESSLISSSFNTFSSLLIAPDSSVVTFLDSGWRAPIL